MRVSQYLTPFSSYLSKSNTFPHRHRRANIEGYPIYTISEEAAYFERLKAHCLDVHGPTLCETLVGMDEDGIRETRAKISRADSFRRAEEAGEVIVLD